MKTGATRRNVVVMRGRYARPISPSVRLLGHCAGLHERSRGRYCTASLRSYRAGTAVARSGDAIRQIIVLAFLFGLLLYFVTKHAVVAALRSERPSARAAEGTTSIDHYDQ